MRSILVLDSYWMTFWFTHAARSGWRWNYGSADAVSTASPVPCRVRPFLRLSWSTFYRHRVAFCITVDVGG